MVILCNDCRHSKVCKHMKHYTDTANSIKCKVPTPFEIKLNCPHYEARIETLFGYTCLNANAASNTASTMSKAFDGTISIAAEDCPEAHYGDYKADQSF